MAEYRHNAVVGLGVTFMSLPGAAMLAWFGIVATSDAKRHRQFWNIWMVLAVIVIIVGLILVVGVLRDWFPTLGEPRAKSQSAQTLSEPGVALYRRELGEAIGQGQILEQIGNHVVTDGDADVWRRGYETWARDTFMWLRKYHPPGHLTFETAVIMPMEGPEPASRIALHHRQMRQLTLRLSNLNGLLERLQ